MDSFLSNLLLLDISVYLRLKVDFASQFGNTECFSLQYDIFFHLLKYFSENIKTCYKHLYIIWKNTLIRVQEKKALALLVASWLWLTVFLAFSSHTQWKFVKLSILMGISLLNLWRKWEVLINPIWIHNNQTCILFNLYYCIITLFIQNVCN